MSLHTNPAYLSAVTQERLRAADLRRMSREARPFTNTDSQTPASALPVHARVLALLRRVAHA